MSSRGRTLLHLTGNIVEWRYRSASNFRSVSSGQGSTDPGPANRWRVESRSNKWFQKLFLGGVPGLWWTWRNGATTVTLLFQPPPEQHWHQPFANTTRRLRDAVPTRPILYILDLLRRRERDRFGSRTKRMRPAALPLS
jgi:hypothetical protein